MRSQCSTWLRPPTAMTSLVLRMLLKVCYKRQNLSWLLIFSHSILLSILILWTITFILCDITDKRFHLLLSMLPFRGLSVCLSVCLSICDVRALCSNGWRYRHDFFGIWQPYVSRNNFVGAVKWLFGITQLTYINSSTCSYLRAA